MNITCSNFVDAVVDSLPSPGRKRANKDASQLRTDSTKKLGARNSGTTVEPEVRLLIDLHTDLGESIIWDERTQRLYFVDINSMKIFSCNADGSDLFSINAPEMVGCIALTTDENLLLAAMNRSVFLVDIAQRKIGRAIATVPEEHGWQTPPSGLRFNDGKAAPGGVLIVGRMSMGWRNGEPGRLYRLHWDEPEEGFFEQLQGPGAAVLPNGLAWDGQRMYHADTGHRKITEYETDDLGVPLRGSPGADISGRTIVSVPESDGTHLAVGKDFARRVTCAFREFFGYQLGSSVRRDLAPRQGVGPDGMTISRDGHLWVAVPGDEKVQGSLICYCSQSGEEITRVYLPVNMAVCCTFGGPKLDTLYVTSRREKGVSPQPEHWGGVFAVNIPGEFGLSPSYKVTIPE